MMMRMELKKSFDSNEITDVRYCSKSARNWTYRNVWADVRHFLIRAVYPLLPSYKLIGFLLERSRLSNRRASDRMSARWRI